MNTYSLSYWLGAFAWVFAIAGVLAAYRVWKYRRDNPPLERPDDSQRIGLTADELQEVNHLYDMSDWRDLTGAEIGRIEELEWKDRNAMEGAPW